MKRCFMTGKQCIFSSQVAEGAVKPISGRDLAVFVVMPFRPNLETFYRWSLKPFLVQGYGIPEKHVQRADEVRDIGYIVCEKICRKIQEADLVLAEISSLNANVFYEIGLAYGLERPIVLMRNAEPSDNVLRDGCVRQSLDLQSHSVFEYPGIQVLNSQYDEHRLSRHITRPRIHEKLIRKLQISALRVDRDQTQQPDSQAEEDDIELNFKQVVPGAVGVAMAEIRNDLKDPENEHAHENWAEVTMDIRDKDWQDFSTVHPVVVDGKRGFDEIAREIERSFCTIVDLSRNDPVACFWLGYCHARGLNAIPVYRIGSVESQPEREHTLAFDIRALWYAEYDSRKPYEFKTKIREILEHLLERDLPDRQKRAFWDRFPPERKLKVFTGAVHNAELNREMVGDWDVRTVSELFSYLPSVREAMAIELVTPLYSPEEAYRHSRAADSSISKEDFIELYRQGIEDQLKDANAIVIASPDVNPVTEYLLHKIYSVKEPKEPFDECKTPEYDGFVVWKKLVKRQSSDQPVSSEQKGQFQFPRLFYRQEETEQHEKSDQRRGFAQHALTHLHIVDKFARPYSSQDECTDEFSLLGHLVIARYPPQDDSGNLVVLLNGVSGPATFALAQILTGGGGGGLHAFPEMKSKSEQMLLGINKLLDRQDCIGVEAIVKIKIVPSLDPSDSTGRDRTYVDSRQVHSWDFLEGPKPIIRP